MSDRIRQICSEFLFVNPFGNAYMCTHTVCTNAHVVCTHAHAMCAHSHNCLRVHEHMLVHREVISYDCKISIELQQIELNSRGKSNYERIKELRLKAILVNSQIYKASDTFFQVLVEIINMQITINDLRHTNFDLYEKVCDMLQIEPTDEPITLIKVLFNLGNRYYELHKLIQHKLNDYYNSKP